MNPTEIRKLGKSGVPLTQLGFGGAPLGELFVRVDEPTAAATLQAAWDAGVRYYDTAPYYGRGLSEIRYGRFLDPILARISAESPWKSAQVAEFRSKIPSSVGTGACK